MFQIKYQDKLYKLPVNTTESDAILQQIDSLIFSNNQEFILSFNKIYLSRHINYNLLEIGYSPHEIIQVTDLVKKKAFFTISDFGCINILTIDPFSNAFTVKQYFAEQFYTVPQNIIITYNNTILSDSEILLQYNTTKDKPFKISVKNNYFLVHTYLDQAHFVCLKLDSTVENLKDTISMYSQKVNSINLLCVYSDKMKEICKQNGIENDADIDQKKLADLSTIIPLFEFTQSNRKLNQTFTIKVNIKDDKFEKEMTREYRSTCKISIYSLTVLLERDLKIDRSLFVPFDQKGEKIDLSQIASPNKKSYIFKIFEPLYVKVGSIQKVSYLTTIRDLRTMNNFESHNFGTIINGHFAYYNSLDKFLVIHFMNNSDNPKNVTTITYKKSKEPSYFSTYTKIEKSRRVRKHFIIPKTMKPDKIASVYLHQSFESIKFLSEGADEITYESSSKQTINYVLTDKRNIMHVQKIEVQGENQRIIDLLLSIYNQENTTNSEFVNFLFGWAMNKYDAAVPYLNKQALNFWDPLSTIFTDENNRITINGFEGVKEMKLLNLAKNSKEFDTIKIKGRPKAHELISNYCQEKGLKNQYLRLFADFNRFHPNDIPSLIKPQRDFLILNIERDKKRLYLKNFTTFKCPLELTNGNYEHCASIIKGMFRLPEGELLFTGVINGKDYFLPQQFDAAAFPDNCEIILRYKYKKLNQMTFCYEGICKVLNVDVEKPIELIIPVIQKEFNLWHLSKKAIHLSFFNFHFPKNQSFAFYQIPETATIRITREKDSFPLQISTPENKAFEDYYFMKGEKIEDLIDHFKKQFRTDIYAFKSSDKKVQLNFSKQLEKNMKIFLSSEDKEIKFEGLLGDKEIFISEILTIKDASKFIGIKNHKKVFIFTKNKDDNSYEPVNEEKRLFECKGQLFAHKIYSKIEFNYEVFKQNERISELNTIGWLKDRFVSKALFISTDDFVIKKNGEILKETETIGKSINKFNGKLEIYIESGIGHKKQTTQSARKYKPTTSPQNSKIDQSKSDTKNKKKKDSNIDILSKTQKPTKKPNFKPVIKRVKSSSDDDENSDDEKRTKKTPNPTRKKIKKSSSDDDEKITKKIPNPSRKIKRKSSSDNDDHHDKIEEEEISDNDNEEEVSSEEEEVKEEEITYRIQIGREEPSSISLKKSATVNDAKILIAKNEGDIDPNCVTILFAGKNLKKNIVLFKLKLTSDDILQIYIRNIEEILLRTAKALRVYGEGNIEEYYSEYEDEGEYDD